MEVIRPTKDPRKPSFYQSPSSMQPEPPPIQAKRPLSTPVPPPRSLSELQELHLSTTPHDNDDVSMGDAPTAEGPRKRAAIGDGISAGSVSPSIPAVRDKSESPPPRRSKARPTSASDSDNRRQHSSPLRPHVSSRKLFNPDQDSPITKPPFNPSNVPSLHTKSRGQAPQSKSRSYPPRGQATNSRQSSTALTPQPSAIYGSKAALAQNYPTQSKDEQQYDIIRQPETRPISQEQLVAEVKGIYAGLVMVEAKCIEVVNKQAMLAQADPGSQPKLNNEQWQALIALHRTLLHEHHDFFLASQHPSASVALRKLASKYAMPARMWRHGIHSFLELLRHRLPASLDHMLAFIYLAYSMMALLYETVPAFEDTWIECLGDLGRYRMAIEDDDIRDREVWTGVARHWYSKASDKAPTTGRLYHHLAILARPNALQQLFYYTKSLCVPVPFTSARESILTHFEPVLNAENGQAQYRLPPLDSAFVKAHGLLFTDMGIERFNPAFEEFISLLDNQIGRVTRKFMEQGCHIAIANAVAMLGFASKDNVLMKAVASSLGGEADIEMQETSGDETSSEMKTFQNAQRLSNSTFDVVLKRIGDPNVLPYIHVTLVFIHHMSRYPGVMSILETELPWYSLAVMLNTLLASYATPGRIEDDKFPLPEKGDVRPFPEDFALRGLLWSEEYFPPEWFSNEKVDEEEKDHEKASMTEQRKERILWLSCRIANSGRWIDYDSSSRQFSVPSIEPHQEASQASTFAAAPPLI